MPYRIVIVYESLEALTRIGVPEASVGGIEQVRDQDPLMILT